LAAGIIPCPLPPLIVNQKVATQLPRPQIIQCGMTDSESEGEEEIKDMKARLPDDDDDGASPVPSYKMRKSKKRDNVSDSESDDEVYARPSRGGEGERTKMDPAYYVDSDIAPPVRPIADLALKMRQNLVFVSSAQVDEEMDLETMSNKYGLPDISSMWQ
jgi:hypothetical protein